MVDAAKPRSANRPGSRSLITLVQEHSDVTIPSQQLELSLLSASKIRCVSADLSQCVHLWALRCYDLVS